MNLTVPLAALEISAANAVQWHKINTANSSPRLTCRQVTALLHPKSSDLLHRSSPSLQPSPCGPSFLCWLLLWDCQASSSFPCLQAQVMQSLFFPPHRRDLRFDIILLSVEKIRLTIDLMKEFQWSVWPFASNIYLLGEAIVPLCKLRPL